MDLSREFSFKPTATEKRLLFRFNGKVQVNGRGDGGRYRLCFRGLVGVAIDFRYFNLWNLALEGGVYIRGKGRDVEQAL